MCVCVCVCVCVCACACAYVFTIYVAVYFFLSSIMVSSGDVFVYSVTVRKKANEAVSVLNTMEEG